MKPARDERILWRHLRELPYFRALVRAVEDSFYQDIDLPPPTLDIGCGDGHFASVAFLRPIEVGLDPSPALGEARRRGGYSLVLRADGGAIPFGRGSFASAVSNSALEHIPHVERVLGEAARVLRAGAPFAFCVPNPRYLEFLSVAALADRLGLRGLAAGYRDWFRRMSRVEHLEEPGFWRVLLERCGFRLERHWDYFSSGAMRTLEWGHYAGLPALFARLITGQWVIWKSPLNLAPARALVRPYFLEALPEKGAFTFFLARRG